MEINLLLVVMIELVQYGIQTQAKSSLVLMSTVMSYIVWRSIIHLGKFKLVNNQFSDKIVTGSFDKKAKIWDANTG